LTQNIARLRRALSAPMQRRLADPSRLTAAAAEDLAAPHV
jgi:hypothetical protein